jgi:16S rRNA processing protein RimM
MVFLGEESHVVRAVRRADRGFQIAFEEIADRDAAEAFRGSVVAVAQRRPLVEGEFWPEQLIGLVVVDETGKEIGFVESVLSGPGQDRLRVKSPRSVFEVPFVDDLVPVVDLEKGRVEIVAIPGLID